MNIAVIATFNEENFGLHIEETLTDMGHNVIRIYADSQFMQYDFLGQRFKSFNTFISRELFLKIPQLKKRKSKEIYNTLKKQKIDFTLVLHDFLDREEVEEIKKITKSPLCLWFPDAMSNFKKAFFFIAGYDFLFFSDKYIVHKMTSEFNLNSFYMPQCFNPKKHKLVESTAKENAFYECEITNAGNLYTSRSALYKNLLNYNMKFWGYPPRALFQPPELKNIIMNKAVNNEEKSKAFSNAKIVLNNLHPAVIDGVNKRTFEIPACGGFQIISYRDAVNELFEIDKEIVAYKNLNDLKEKIDYYLQHDDERTLITTAGNDKAIKNHTYQHRLIQILDICMQ